MATIGLDKLYYAKITEDASGEETYASPVQLAKAMTAELSVELAEATLYADDGAAEIVKEFKICTLSFSFSRPREALSVSGSLRMFMEILLVPIYRMAGFPVSSAEAMKSSMQASKPVSAAALPQPAGREKRIIPITKTIKQSAL